MSKHKQLPYIWNPPRYKAKWVSSFNELPECDPLYSVLKTQQAHFPRVAIHDCDTQYMVLDTTSHPAKNLEAAQELVSEGLLISPTKGFENVDVLRQLSPNAHVQLSKLFDYVRDLPTANTELRQVFSTDISKPLKTKILRYISRYSVLSSNDHLVDTFASLVRNIRKMYFFVELLADVTTAKDNDNNYDFESWLQSHLEIDGTDNFLPKSFGLRNESVSDFEKRLNERFWLEIRISNQSFEPTEYPMQFKVRCGALDWCFFELWYTTNGRIRYRRCEVCGTPFPYQRNTKKTCSNNCKQKKHQDSKG